MRAQRVKKMGAITLGARSARIFLALSPSLPLARAARENFWPYRPLGARNAPKKELYPRSAPFF